MLCIVARLITIAGVSQRVVRDPSKPVETAPRRWLGETLEAIGDEPSGKYQANRHSPRAIANAGPRIGSKLA